MTIQEGGSLEVSNFPSIEERQIFWGQLQAAFEAWKRDHDIGSKQDTNTDWLTLSLYQKYLPYTQDETLVEEKGEDGGDDANSERNTSAALAQEEERELQESIKSQRRQRQDVGRQLLAASRDFLFLPPLDDATTSSMTVETPSSSPASFWACLTVWLFQYLLSNPKNGYDARVRHVIKKMAVTVLTSGKMDDPLVHWNIRKLEALEQTLASRLVGMAAAQKNSKDNSDANDKNSDDSKAFQRNMIRGLKVGAIGVAAGTLFAVTGGMAAPGIAAGLSLLLGSGVAGTFLALASTTAVTALFGVAGGSLAAYKMNRRTIGLTEFTFQRQDDRFPHPEEPPQPSTTASAPQAQQQQQQAARPELFRTICVSGWIRDSVEFQKPWGILRPWDPPITSDQELLERFYAIYNPPLVVHASTILQNWSTRKEELWMLLENKYGQTPKDLFDPTKTNNNNNTNAMKIGPALKLNQEEETMVDQIVMEIGNLMKDKDAQNQQNPLNSSATAQDEKASEALTSSTDQPDQTKSKGGRFKGFTKGLGKLSKKAQKAAEATSSNVKKRLASQQQPQEQQEVSREDSTQPSSPASEARSNKNSAANFVTQFGQGLLTTLNLQAENHDASQAFVSADEFEKVTHLEDTKIDNDSDEEEKKNALPKHLATLWHYGSRYGGELYTVRWESDLLIEMCDSVAKFYREMASSAGKEVLKQTVAATLVLAAALPLAVLSAANMIDGAWTLTIERCDAAGKELARSLVFSPAGHRPVTLVGFSFGGRMILSCLKELAKYQLQWEEQQQEQASQGQKQQQQKPTQDTKKKFSFRPPGISSQKKQDEDEEIETDDSKRIPVEPASIVEDAILIGTPAYMNPKVWSTKCRPMVSGRLVNVFSRKDRLLSLMFRFKRLTGVMRPICGICTIPGVENVDVSDLISNHEDYGHFVGEILSKRVHHGQPVSLAYNAVDEMEILQEAQLEASKQEQTS